MKNCRGNPYLKAFRRLGPDDKWAARMKLVRKYAWAIPDSAAITRLASFSPIIEIGAGAGYWACLLKTAGANVVAFDPNPPGSENHYLENNSAGWFPVQRGDASTLSKYPKHTLFICWPPVTGWAYKTLLAFKGERFVFVGEGHSGWDNKFFGLLGDLPGYYEEEDPAAYKIKPQWERVEEIDIPCWPGIRDTMVVYKRLQMR